MEVVPLDAGRQNRIFLIKSPRVTPLSVQKLLDFFEMGCFYGQIGWYRVCFLLATSHACFHMHGIFIFVKE